GCHGGRRSSIPSPVKPLHRRPKLPSTARARHRRHHVEHGAPPPSTATNDAHEDAIADRPRPTTVGPSLPRSKPFITMETTSSFQIRRGRKPTLITEATRGESSSPVHYTTCIAHLLPDEHHTSARRCHDHRLARANCRRCCPRTATASARCPLPASTAFIHAVRCLQQRPRSSGSKAPPA
ncbi:hypothetical protein ACLOJK_004592, partial [Asimina triloba]